MDYQSLIRDIPDFPKPGIIFKDITPLLANAEALDAVIKDMAAPFKDQKIDLVVGIESRGFIFGPGVARQLGCGFAPVRKPGKLPYHTHSLTYDLEYGTDTLEIHVDAVVKDHRVLIIDDLLATGGTAEAAGKLIAKIDGIVVGFGFVIELGFLNGREKLGNTQVESLINYT
ncbi:adenine phosphoribosyltransferase [Acanthopleuribacter pedis]|uniref:Adenine phosphoribosyltransferase n=1 Tax=Acanthopleuribacter pedis TaxID=442870 RepID=A0A8J7QEG0_9BACT|nr:adenine phosphoribosyltransferase [Acanthopleuribacter pedis]MBO1316825.1 adenine phosphoribosyltransferase [Acanthopleuribacter pedis]